MARRLEVAIKENVSDIVGGRLMQKLASELNLKINSIHFVEVYNINEDLNDQEMEKLGKEVFTDSVIQDFNYRSNFYEPYWKLEIGYLPGVTDNVAKTAMEGIKDSLGKEVEVYYSRVYAIYSDGIDVAVCEKVANLLYNPLVEKFILHSPLEPVKPYTPKVVLKHEPSVEKINLRINEQRLESLAKQRLLALSLDEFKAIKNYLKEERVLSERAKVGLDSHITDVELECIAQTWSEHCKHKIFNAMISYQDNGEPHAINSIFKTFIRASTEMIKKPYVVSVFKDNGGIIKFNHDWDIAVKVETHNAPSALDPYGGALTGVLGVQRDILGTGLGAEPIANVDMLCFGPLSTKTEQLPKGVLHPKRIYDGVVKGIEHGGNKMGIPTINGSITYEPGFIARPLVFCGTIGLLPSVIRDRKTSDKKIEPEYLAVMVGGRIGKDGIHGATFSSQQIDETVPQSVVQIGDPITQKKMLDFVLEARDGLLYEAVTDNGAGGISSSIGELAQLSGGCEIYLDKCPLKYPGLDPWEILVSESQERMTLAVPKKNVEKLQHIAAKHGVEISVVGKFTDSGKFHVFFNGETVAYLDMGFLHDGLPQMKLTAVWKRKVFSEPSIPEVDPSDLLKQLLSSPNIATKESVVRQYDHEVKGMSVVKPFMMGPSDAGVIRPLLDSKEGLAVAHGICPRFVQDSYDMAALAFDEAVRNAIASGAKFGYLAALDNFSWPDPIQSFKTPDGETKLGDLVRACISLYDNAIAYGVPLISGKDSMKNDYYSGDVKYSIPPTLVVTVIGKIDDIENATTVEFKQAGDMIYILGKTRDELGGSELYRLFGAVGNNNPKLRTSETIPLYRALSQAIGDGLVASAHDVSDGGIAVALAECSFPANFGIDVDLGQMHKDTDSVLSLLFSESAGRFIISVSEKNIEAFEKLMHGKLFAKVGRVRGDRRFIIRKNEVDILINVDISDLKLAWNNPKY